MRVILKKHTHPYVNVNVLMYQKFMFRKEGWLSLYTLYCLYSISSYFILCGAIGSSDFFLSYFIISLIITTISLLSSHNRHTKIKSNHQIIKSSNHQLDSKLIHWYRYVCPPPYALWNLRSLQHIKNTKIILRKTRRDTVITEWSSRYGQKMSLKYPINVNPLPQIVWKMIYY